MDTSTLAHLWDSSEKERVEAFSFDSLRGLEPAAIREKLFPIPVVRRLRQPHASVFFSDLDDPGFIPTLLLFYDTLAIEGCKGCMTSKRLLSASALIDRGLIVPMVNSAYDQLHPDAVKFLEKYQDDHVSVHAESKYLFSALNPASLSKNGQRVYCLNCIRNEVHDIGKTAPGISTETKSALEQMTRTLSRYPSPIMMQLLEPVREYVNRNDSSSLMRLSAQTYGLVALDIARTFESVRVLRLDNPLARRLTRLGPLTALFPSMKPDLAEMIDFCSKGLKLDFTPDMPLGKYLDIVQDYRGTLRSTIPKDVDPTVRLSSTVEVVSQMNEQLREISVSKRYRVGTYVAAVGKIPLIKLILQLTVGGDHGIGSFLSQAFSSTLQKPVSPLKSDKPRTPTLTDRFLSKYFGKDLPTVQLWNLQRKVGKVKGKT